MKSLFTLSLLSFVFAACQPKSKSCDCSIETPVEETVSSDNDFQNTVRSSLVRINSTIQEWNAWQPWEKDAPAKRTALAAIIDDQRVITTAELAANATYIEFESADGTRLLPARVIARDDEANLALLGPANAENGKAFFANTTPLKIADPASLGDTFQILQLEANGLALITPGTLQSVDVTGGFIPGNYFLSYLVKASMQSAAGSYSLPVLRDGKLAGILISYDSSDQICEIASTDILTRFLQQAEQTPYVGFPTLGVQVAVTEDTSFRQWLQLADDQGGLYVQQVHTGSAAEAAGLLAGDVILAVDGHPIDRRGYYEHTRYGSLLWSHLIRGEKAVGDPLTLTVQREGQSLEITATLHREEEAEKLVPNMLPDKAPNYLVKGGFIFQELTRTILTNYGKDWQSRAPLNLLSAYENPETFGDEWNRVVFLSGVIPTPATIGYERLRNLMISKVNGKEIHDMKTLVEAFKSNTTTLHSIEFLDETLVIYLDEQVSSFVDHELLKRGLAQLSHTDESPPAQDK